MADSFHEGVLEDTPAPTGAGDEDAAANGSELPFAEGGPEDPPKPRIGYPQYLESPIVTLLVGSGDSEHVLAAHQALLTQSTWFAEQCAEFANDGSVRTSTAHPAVHACPQANPPIAPPDRAPRRGH